MRNRDKSRPIVSVSLEAPVRDALRIMSDSFGQSSSAVVQKLVIERWMAWRRELGVSTKLPDDGKGGSR